MLQERTPGRAGDADRLNPFEVREVLQDVNAAIDVPSRSLNPFEVREVLQGL